MDLWPKQIIHRILQKSYLRSSRSRNPAFQANVPSFGKYLFKLVKLSKDIIRLTFVVNASLGIKSRYATLKTYNRSKAIMMLKESILASLVKAWKKTRNLGKISSEFTRVERRGAFIDVLKMRK